MPYGTDQGFTAWLATYGYVLPAGSPTPAVLRARGSAYLDGTYEALWTGERVDGVMQELGWPRLGAVINCATPIPSDVIPPAIVGAAYRAAWLDAQTPGILSGSVSAGGRVKRQKVDVIEREFFDDGAVTAGSGGPAFIDAEIDGAMRPFICDQNGGAFIWAIGSDGRGGNFC